MMQTTQLAVALACAALFVNVLIAFRVICDLPCMYVPVFLNLFVKLDRGLDADVVSFANALLSNVYAIGSI